MIGNIDINVVVVYTVDHPEDGISEHLNRLKALLLENHLRKIDCNIHRLTNKIMHFTLFKYIDKIFLYTILDACDINRGFNCSEASASYEHTINYLNWL